MKLKKIPYYFLLFLLTIGAGLIIGFLSFTGMFTIVPLVTLAIGAFVLSVAYEGEIYFQNIKGAFAKLFKRDYLQNHLANEFLLKLFTQELVDTKDKDCPKFFGDYEAQLHLLDKFGHKRLDEASQKRKKQIKKTLRDMEKWFALQLFSSETETELTSYESMLRAWLKAHGQDDAKKLLQKRSAVFNGVKVFSALAGIFMCLGTTYLLIDAFAALPILAAISFTMLPAIVVPMAILAGVAYSFLIYNAVTDMINNDSLRKWYYKLRDDLSKGVTPRTVTMAVSAVLLLLLTVALTICTAGTWWTVAKHTRPLFSWMGKISNIIASSIAIITGSAQLIFNLENVFTSLELIQDAFKKDWSEIRQGFSKGFNALLRKENLLQLLNLPRLILLLTFVPLRFILFIGHLLGVSVSSDRVPGIHENISAGLGFISEFFEDLHYFLGDLFHSHRHSHDTKNLIEERFQDGHGHDHSTDLPTQALRLVFSPLFLAAAAWDWAATRLIKKPRQECGLLQMDSDPKSWDFKDLAIQGKNAVILYEGQLYYADVNKERVKKIKLNKTNGELIDEFKEAFTDSYKAANEDELNCIFALTGHHNSDTTLSREAAWARQTGQSIEKSVTITADDKQPSGDWRAAQASLRISKYIDKHLNRATLDPQGYAPQKAAELGNLRQAIRAMENPTEETIKDCIADNAKEEVYEKQRHDYSFLKTFSVFTKKDDKTRTQTFVEEDLPQRISASAAA